MNGVQLSLNNGTGFIGGQNKALIESRGDTTGLNGLQSRGGMMYDTPRGIRTTQVATAMFKKVRRDRWNWYTLGREKRKKVE